MLKLVVLQGVDAGRLFEVVAQTATVGRGQGDISLRDPSVSRRHARLVHGEGRWRLEDLGSANGTAVNGVRIGGFVTLKQGDQLRLGSTVLLCRNVEDAGRASMEATEFIKLDASGGLSDGSIAARMSAEDTLLVSRTGHGEAALNLSVLYRLNTAISNTFAVPQLVEAVLEILVELLGVSRACVLLYEPPESDHLRPIAAKSRGAETGMFRVPRSLVEHVVSRRESILLSDASLDGGDSGVVGRGVGAAGLSRSICVPVTARDSLLGVIYVAGDSASLGEAQMQLVSAVGQQAGLAIENARLFDVSLRAERINATGETVAYLSHYIKNILQGLRGGADVLDLGLRRGEFSVIRSGWEVVGRNVDKIYTLMLNMLAFSKDREPRLEPVNLNSVVGEVLELVRSRCRDKRVLLVDRLDAFLPPVPADSTGVHHALLNVVSNAVDAVSAEQGVVTVRTRYLEEEGFVEIEVQDNGPGIPLEQQAEIFQPFHSTKGQGGTGLGLAVAKKILDEHRGELRLRSVVGEGSAFTLLIPTRPRGDGEPVRLEDTNSSGIGGDPPTGL